MSHPFWERVADFTLRRSRPILGGVLLLTLFFTLFLFRIEIASDVRSFHRKDAAQLIQTIEDRFKEGRYLVLIFESQSDKSLLTPALLHQQLKVLQEIKKRYPVKVRSYVDAIDEGLKRTRGKSLLDTNEFSPIAEGIIALSGGRTVRDLEKVSRHLLSHPEAISFYAKLRLAAMKAPPVFWGASKRAFEVPFVKAAEAFLQFEAGHPEGEERKISVSIRDLADSFATPDLKVYAVSEHLLGHDTDLHARQNLLLMGFLLVAVDALLLWITFRNVRELFLVLFILITASLWTFGTAGFLGIRLTVLHLIALPILLGVGIDNSFVIGGRLNEERAGGKDLPSALRSTFAATGKGVFLTTFTTFFAFVSSALTSGSEAIVSFNSLVALSMAFCFFLTVLLQGAIRSELHKKGPATASPLRPAGEKAFSHPFFRRLTSRPRTILLTWGLSFLSALGLLLFLETEFDLEIFMRKTMPIYRANQILDRYFGRTCIGYILLEGAVENPLLLQKMMLLEERIGRIPDMENILGRANVESVNDLAEKKKIAITAATPMREVFDEITRSEETANYVLNQSYREAAEHLVHKGADGYDSLLMKFFATTQDSRKIRSLVQSLEEEIQELKFEEIPGLKVRVGGGMVSSHIEAGYYFGNFIRSFFVTLVATFLVILFLWKRFWHSLLAMIPIVVSVALTLGLMPLFGVKLNVLNLCIGAIVVGLGDDYPIHIIERFEEERRKGFARLEAVQNILNSMGSKLVGCFLTTSVGFGTSCVLAMPVAESFGLLTALAVFFVFLASITILPALLVGRGGALSASDYSRIVRRRRSVSTSRP